MMTSSKIQSHLSSGLWDIVLKVKPKHRHGLKHDFTLLPFGWEKHKAKFLFHSNMDDYYFHAVNNKTKNVVVFLLCLSENDGFHFVNLWGAWLM